MSLDWIPAVQCSWLEDLQHSIEESGESQEGRGGTEGELGSRDGGEGAEGEDMKWAIRGLKLAIRDKRFGDEGGARVQH